MRKVLPALLAIIALAPAARAAELPPRIVMMWQVTGRDYAGDFDELKRMGVNVAQSFALAGMDPAYIAGYFRAAGAAGIGIARLIRDSMSQDGVPDAELAGHIAILDSQGLLVEGHGTPDHHKRDFVWKLERARALGIDPERADLLRVVSAVKPTVLLGTSGQPGSFSEAVVRAMAAGVERPLVFPMSNPTSMSEAQPADVVAWTRGKALVATGSPFAPVVFEGREMRFGQANNAFVFPGIGLGCLLSGVREVSDGLFAAASTALAERVTAEDLDAGSVYPRVDELRRVTVHVAAAVVRAARDEGQGRGFSDEEILPAVEAAMWEPLYPKLVPSRELEPAGMR